MSTCIADVCVYMCVEEYTFKQHLVEENGCQLLLPLLSHADCDVLKNTVKGLSLLTTHHTARITIANENGMNTKCMILLLGVIIKINVIVGFPALLALLDSEYAEIQELVLHTLEHCLHNG